MCDFVSWVEKDGVVFFLTGEQVYNTPRGKELQARSQNIEEDKSGHGAIRWYYNFEGGVNQECTDFSSPPTNFPPEIVKAIKTGAMRGIGFAPSLLTQTANADYARIVLDAYADYDRIVLAANADYDRIVLAANADYDRIVKATTYADYLRIKKAAKADYLSIEKAAYADYLRIKKAAKADYDRIVQNTFWDLFSIPEHRAEGWK